MIKAKIEFKKEDCWIGIYWKNLRCDWGFGVVDTTDIYVCLLPMLPIHVMWIRPRRK